MFGIASTVPSTIDPGRIVPRTDEINGLWRILNEAQTSTVFLVGSPGTGKSTLAALLYRRLQLTTQTSNPGQHPRHLIWLTLGQDTTLPDLIAAILASLPPSPSSALINNPGFLLLTPEQQNSLLVQTLRRSQESAFIILDQFEELLEPSIAPSISQFLDLLQQTDLGASRLLLTSRHSPYEHDNRYEQAAGNNPERYGRVQLYPIAPLSLPEGMALLQQCGIQSTNAELALLYQQCHGHPFALVLFSFLVALRGLLPSSLLNSPSYPPLWNNSSSELITSEFIALVVASLSPTQSALIHTLALFREPVPFRGLVITMLDENAVYDGPTFEREWNRLSGLSLVQQYEHKHAHNIPYYSMHPLMRQYILEHYLAVNPHRSSGQLEDALGVSGPLSPLLDHQHPEAQQVALAAGHMQVALYYQQLASTSCPPKEKRRGPQDVAPLLATVCHLCLGWHWQQACDLLFAEGLHESMVQWGAWNILIELYTAMLPPRGALAYRDEGLVASHLGLLYGRLGDSQRSLSCFTQALIIQREIGDQQGQATTLANQGELLRVRGERQQARTLFEQALLLNNQRQNLLLESVLRYNLGLIAHAEKDYQQALSYYLVSFRLASSLQESYKVGMILTNLGMLLYEQGNLQEALALLLAALQLRQSLQDPTISVVERFLSALEQKIGSDTFARLCQSAQGSQEQVLSRLMTANMRQ